MSPAPGEAGTGVPGNRRIAPAAPGPGLSGWLFGLRYTISPIQLGRWEGSSRRFSISSSRPRSLARVHLLWASRGEAPRGDRNRPRGAARHSALGHLRARGGGGRAEGLCAPIPARAEIGAAVPRHGPARAEEGIAGAPREPPNRFAGPCRARWTPARPRCEVTCFARRVAIAAPVAVAASS